AQLGDGLPAELVLSLPRATIDQACSARTVVLLSGDVREELPVLYLRLREAALEGGANLVELAARATSLTRHAAVSLPVRPGDAPAIARAVTGDDAAAALLRSHPEGPAWPAEALTRARELIGSGDTVVVVVGRPSLAEHEDVVAEAARILAGALPGARFLTALRRGNVLGALDMGLSPGLLPGRVSLEDGRDWFGARWGSVPRARGRGAAGVLTSLAGDGEDRVRALIALGTDVSSDFPDRQLADRALSAGAFVVTVSGHPSPIVDRADVVLPAAVTHERPGTTTNIEGRLSRLGQKLVAPGQAWPDWMIATELAAGLGGDLGVSGVADLWDEIERVAPAYAGATAAVLDSPAARDGVLVPFDPETGAGVPQPIDPIALPGVESVERQGAPPRVGLALGWLPAGGTTVEPEPGSAGGPTAPPTLDRAESGTGADPAPEVPAVDSYSLRLVASRRLYDGGAAVGGSPSLAALVPVALVRANPYDLDRLGATTGDRVRVRSARGALELPAEADAAVPRGVVAVDFNLPSPDGVANAAATLIDASAAVTEVRLESVG
ncbi:MAG TPA: molybdopterin-dependent oxidoreductase, partial [Acidimicrobiales bacterium]|nr:molybdopterin-dependent oxidoreductase [Acidimicrobiales bacterium]